MQWNEEGEQLFTGEIISAKFVSYGEDTVGGLSLCRLCGGAVIDERRREELFETLGR